MRKFITGFVAVLLIISTVFLVVFNEQKGKLLSLGLNVTKVEALTKDKTPLEVILYANDMEKQVTDDIAKNEQVLRTEIGLDEELVLGSSNMKPIDYNTALVQFIDESREYLNANITSLDTQIKEYQIDDSNNYEDKSLYTIYESKNKLVLNKVGTLNEQLSKYEQQLLDYGFSEAVISELQTDNLMTNVKTLQAKVAGYDKYLANISTAGNNFVTGNMELFNRLNQARIEVGVTPFTYNYEQQACVDLEAMAYANNKNPHNWLCKTLISEGASISSVKSDYVNIAGNFLTTHGSHRRGVINPSFSSAACSMVERGGVVHMICGYFS